MASKRKKHYYVLVCTDDGPKFVTKNDYSTKYSHWETDRPPLDMTKAEAEDIALGLNLNFNLCFVVTSDYEILHHPYRYESGHFEWEENENESKQVS